jgi:hypothetical protein
MRKTSLPRALAASLALLALSVGACSDDDKAQGGSDTVSPGDDTTQPGADTTGGTDTSTPVEGSTRLETLLDSESVALVFGKSQAMTVEVPPNAVSLSISVIGEPGNRYVLNAWTDPNGTALVTEDWILGEEGQGGLCISCPNRVTSSDAAFAALAPNNPSVTLTPGTHTFTIFGLAPKPVVQEGTATCNDGICHFFDQFQCPQDCGASPTSGFVDVSITAKVSEDGALPETGVLDLNLHFTGAEGLTAASAQTDANFQASLETVRTLYRQVGIEIGTLTYRDVDSRFQVIETFDGPDSDLIEMFESSDGNPTGLNLFFVSELSAGQFGGFGVILGISGGIPGPPLEQGTPRSGVAIAIKPVQGAPAGIDTTIAHEAGHFLGLYHTSEQNFFGGPGIHDPIPDTPENDDSYLMFNTGSGSNLSVQQGVVMRANPFVRHPTAN